MTFLCWSHLTTIINMHNDWHPFQLIHL